MKRSLTLAAFASLLVLACDGGRGPAAPATSGVPLFAQDGGTGPLSGAIFTTTVDGAIVNENVHYAAKEDVYLDGGPGPHAPSTAAGLPEGNYYFQVTDPSGQDLLSSDHISCRQVHVNADGVIDAYIPGLNWDKVQGKWTQVDCTGHATGIDQDHAELGAITVQLFPYDDTPNPGGVYKVWITPVEAYAGDPNLSCPETGQCNVNGESWDPPNFHGFIPSHSKTDNYKVEKKGKPFEPPVISVRKFHDANINGVQDEGEEDVTGWLVDVTDPLGVENPVYTPETIDASVAGTYVFVEDTPTGTLQTVSYLDGSQQSFYPSADPTVNVPVAGTSGETHAVVYGNVGVGSVKACKVYDRDGDGVPDDDEPGVPGWEMVLTGTDVTGATVGPLSQTTGSDGCTTFASLLPGSYTVTETIPTTGTWISTGSTSATVEITSSLSGATMTGTAATVSFTNFCEGYAAFGTKGYWHNKNGLDEITDADIVYVNGLSPYSAPSSYFGDGDEPFDGYFEDGTPVAAAYNNDKITDGIAAGEGTPRAEISHFLVDANAGADPREQLAQQLLAFIFNTRHRLDAPSATIQLPDGSFVSAQSLIDAAIAAWESGTADEQHQMESLLDALNNSTALPFIHFYPCSVIYP